MLVAVLVGKVWYVVQRTTQQFEMLRYDERLLADNERNTFERL